MKAGKKPGLLCRSHAATAVCRSQASIAACVPADPRAAAIVPPPRWSNEVKYARLGGDARRVAAGGDRIQAVTLPMVTTRERAPPPEPKARPRPTCSSNAAAATTASVVPVLTSARDQLFQVVVMRVSLHCQGCAGKVRKHISKMEGVTSFSIDLESKRVTVMGHVSPVGVLESISKVKKAEFWTC